MRLCCFTQESVIYTEVFVIFFFFMWTENGIAQNTALGMHTQTLSLRARTSQQCVFVNRTRRDDYSASTNAKLKKLKKRIASGIVSFAQTTAACSKTTAARVAVRVCVCVWCWRYKVYPYTDWSDGLFDQPILDF